LHDGMAKFIASMASQIRRVPVRRLGQTRRFRSLRMCGRSQDSMVALTRRTAAGAVPQ
jgi:hypothetical protein